MKDLRDLLPKTEKVAVGSEVLTLATMTAAQRDAVFRLLFEELDVDELAGALEDAARKAGEQDTEADSTQRLFFLGKIVGFARQLLTSNMTKVMAVVLDTPVNRKAAPLDGKDVEVKPDANGVSACNGFRRWVGESITIEQEQAVLEAAARVNGFADLVKNYVALVGDFLKPAGEEKPPSGNESNQQS